MPKNRFPKVSENKLVEYQNAFAIFETDGSITTNELGTVLRYMGHKVTEEELHELVVDMDADGNGTIEFPEFVNLMLRYMDPEEEVREAFKIFDEDKDGFISADELRLVVTTLGAKMSDEEADEMIQKADINGDGKINYEEFVSTLSKRKTQ